MISFCPSRVSPRELCLINLNNIMKTTVLLIALIALVSLTGKAQVKDSAQNASLPKGNRAPASYFTGPVWLYPLATDSLAHWSAAKVTFEPGSHSNWHTHDGKQVLVITEGPGYLKEKGKPIRLLKKGDVVTIEPGVKHWHGATPQKEFVQLVINPEIKNGVVVNWMEPVTDEEYKSGNK